MRSSKVLKLPLKTPGGGNLVHITLYSTVNWAVRYAECGFTDRCGDGYETHWNTIKVETHNEGARMSNSRLLDIPTEE